LFGELGNGWCVLPLNLSLPGIHKGLMSLDEDVPVRVVITWKMILIPYIKGWKSAIHGAIPLTVIAGKGNR
jgi:hypothetical protein